MPLSHIKFMRRLSIQPEESGADIDDEQNEQGATTMSQLCDGLLQIHDAEDLPVSPCTKSRASSHENFQDGDEMRKLSIISNRSSSSLSSTCSAPGFIGNSIGPCSGSYQSSSPLAAQMELESYDMKPMTKQRMTSRPSFISLCSIVSETSETPHRLLPAPLQVELDLMMRSGIEGDEPKCRSHLPILRCSSDYDINEIDVGQIYMRSNRKGLVKGIKDFPKRMRKMSTEKNRFDIYSISDETREQLKQLYVY